MLLLLTLLGLKVSKNRSTLTRMFNTRKPIIVEIIEHRRGEIVSVDLNK